MTEPNTTRRDLLRVAGTTTVFGFGNNSVAAEDSPSQSSSDGHGVPYDAVVTNNNGQKSDISLTIYDDAGADGKKAVFGRRNELDSATKRRERLDLSKGTYTVKATYRGSTTTTTWYVPEGGIPEWNALSVSVTPSNDIKLREIEV